LANPLLALGKALGEIRDSVFHALLNVEDRNLVPPFAWIFSESSDAIVMALQAHRGDEHDSLTPPAWATPHAGQVDAFQDQRQLAQPYLDSGWRGRAIVPHCPRRSWNLESPAFKSPVPDHKPIACEPQYFHAVTAAIEE